jgi:RNA polymerase sigma-70 factor (ECF subfamily)
MAQETEEVEGLLARAGEGDRAALDDLFTRHRERLLRMVRMRLDRRVQGRVDAADVIQETYVEALERLEDYLADRKLPFFLWLRFLAGQKVLQLHRHHLGAQRRDPRQEVRLHGSPRPEATSVALAQQLLGTHTAPSEAAARAELRGKLEEALNGMDDVDREILALRHFEQLSNAEAALELGLDEAAASKRYVRALRRLKGVLAGMEGDFGV